MTEGQLYVARESFQTSYQGQAITVTAGQTVIREGHPLLRGREHLFEPFKPHLEWGDEDTSAAQRQSPRRRAEATS